MLPSTATLSYTRTAKALHWLIALLLIAQLAVGWLMGSFPGTARFTAFQLHKSTGITILLLSLARLAWRLMHKPPPLPPATPAAERIAAVSGHALLYAAMIVMPLSGWIMVTASPLNMPTILFWTIPWPAFPGVTAAAARPEIHLLSETVHNRLALIFALLIAGHVAAALHHHFIRRDAVLHRMAPRALAGFLERIRGRA